MTTQRRRPTLRRAAFRLLTAFGVLGVGLLVLEVLVRVTVGRPVRLGAGVFSVELAGGERERVLSLIPYARYTTHYASDPRGEFGPGNTVTHVANSQGWRDVEHARVKAPGTYRILGLGDSYLYGEGVRREDTCLTLLPALLAGETSGTIEVLNTGLPGSNTTSELEILREWGLGQSPDMVLLHFVLNDVEPSAWRASGPKVECFHGVQAAREGETSWLRERSVLFDLLDARLLSELRGERYNDWMLEAYMADSANWAEMTQALDGLEQVCRDAGIPLAVVVFPFFVQLEDYPFQPIHDLVVAHCEQLGLPVLDLRSAYHGFEGPELWVHPTDQHPNAQAHRLAARATAAFLVAQRDRLGLPE